MQFSLVNFPRRHANKAGIIYSAEYGIISKRLSNRFVFHVVAIFRVDLVRSTGKCSAHVHIVSRIVVEAFISVQNAHAGLCSNA